MQVFTGTVNIPISHFEYRYLPYGRYRFKCIVSCYLDIFYIVIGTYLNFYFSFAKFLKNFLQKTGGRGDDQPGTARRNEIQQQSAGKVP